MSSSSLVSFSFGDVIVMMCCDDLDVLFSVILQQYEDLFDGVICYDGIDWQRFAMLYHCGILH